MSEINDKIYDNYLLFIDNLNYIYNRSLFNNNLKKFIHKCNKYNIKFYDKINDTYYIYKKKLIIEQINVFKKNIVQKHINKLKKIMNDGYQTNDYFELNNNILEKNKINLNKINKLLFLTDIIYDYNLLEIGIIKKYDTDYINKYNNIVKSTDINNEYLKYIDNGIIIIDDYSTD